MLRTLICAVGLVFAAQAAAQTSAPATQPTSQPASQPIRSLSELDGAYLEVLQTPQGLRKTQRCGVDDQLVLSSEGGVFLLRWSGTTQARRYPDPRLVQGVLVIEERRRTIEIARMPGDLLRVRFVRSGGRTRSYLYGRVEVARALPMVEVDDEGCEY
ncbi:MAG: hypothetical protein ABIJ09_21595 [Pseudomonadota bacterium]